MEADINEHEVTDSTTNVRDTGQERVPKMATEENFGFYPSPALKSSTPIIDKNEDGFSEQVPTLLRDDSGFSEGTFISTPTSNLFVTPCTSLISPVSDASSSSHASPLQRRPSLSGCEISPIVRKRFPIRIKRHRHSDPGFNSLALRIQFMEDNVCPKQSQSDTASGESAEGESDVKDEIERITSTTEKSLKRSLLRNALDRSRSSSRSPSSASDDLEASFQEMSLEESSSESRLSPNSLLSSSPSSRPQSPVGNGEVGEEILVLNCDKQSYISTNETLPSTPRYEEKLDYRERPSCPAADSQPVNQVTFAASLALTPKFQIPESCKDCSPSLLNDDTVIPDMSKACVKSLTLKRSCFNEGEHNSKPLASILSPSADVSLLTMSISDDAHVPDHSHISTILSKTPTSSPAKSRYNDRYYSCLSLSPSKSPHENFPLKSPTKRCSGGQTSNFSISPQKMRRKMVQVAEKTNLSVRNVKKNFMSSNLLVPQTQHTKIERSPQYLHMDLFSETEVPSSADDVLYHESSILSEHLDSIPDSLLFGADSSSHLGPLDPFHKVIKMFSPPEPSRLIGRRVGLVKYDIIGELTKQNFLGCLENIFELLPDSDLISVLNVSPIWRSAVFGDPSSLHRYRKLRLAQRRVMIQQGKENFQGKLKDNGDMHVTSAKGPLSTVQERVVIHKSPETDSQEIELMWDDTRRICPTCNGPALVHPAENRATCLRGNCAFVFCTLCFSAFHHPNPCKPLFQAASKADLAGTRKSKKHLKRL